MRVQHPRTTFMTGATGFLGQFILRDLLTRGHRVVAMIRPPMGDNRDRLLALLADIGFDARPCIDRRQLLIVEGTLPGRLPEPEWGQTDDILHNAASLQLFSNGNEDPHLTNVAGTQAVIDWADCHRIRHIQAVSTAYTCGWNTGTISESFHEPRPQFQTDYEQTKWLAEAMFREWSQRPDNTLTLFRPSFLIGDTQTGYTTQFGGFYQFARLVGVLKEQYRDPNNGRITHIPLRIPGRAEDRQDVIPVDFVSRIMTEVVLQTRYHGRIYHLTNPQPPTNDFFKGCYEAYYGLEGGYFADPDQVLNQCTSAESLLWNRSQVLTYRLLHPHQFDTTNTREVMAETGITFPVVDQEYILRLFSWADARGWGRGSSGK